MANSHRSRSGKKRNLRRELGLVKLILSPFQLEVALLYRRGFGRDAIAAALGVSPGTVKVVLRQIRSRLGSDWQHNAEYVWPEETPRVLAEAPTVPAPDAGSEQPEVRWFTADELLAGKVPQWRRIYFTGLQRFWLKPVLDRLEDAEALKFLAAEKDEIFAPPWLSLVHHRRRVRSAVYRVRDAQAVFNGVAGFLQAGLHERAVEVLARIETARGLRGPWRKFDLPGRDEICALLREAFGEAGKRVAVRVAELAVLCAPHGEDA